MEPEFLAILERGAIDLEGKIKEKILSSVPPENAPSTIARKGSSITLIDTGEMLNSVTHRLMESGNEFEVGIFDEVVLERAMANEFGTPHVPERSFLRSTYDEEINRINREMADEITDLLIKKLELK